MIYHVQSTKCSSLNLWRVNLDTFRILEFGDFMPLMVGSDYTIVNKELVSVFQDLLREEVEIKPIKITRRATGEYWEDFFELVIKEHLDVEKIKIIDSTELSVWQYQHDVFVSENLKNALEHLSNGELEFSVGFSSFG